MIKNHECLFKNTNMKDVTNININKVDSTDISNDTTCVENYKGVLQYKCDNINRSIILTTFLKNELTQLFGKHNTSFKGEFLYSVWIVEFDNEIFHIYTAKNKGTQFSIVGHLNDDKANVCIMFLEKMEKLLNNVRH
jgi:hypothetical protein